MTKLKEKGYLGNISSTESVGIQEIVKERNYINLFTTITYGSGFKKRLKKTSKRGIRVKIQKSKIYI